MFSILGLLLFVKYKQYKQCNANVKFKKNINPLKLLNLIFRIIQAKRSLQQEKV